MTELNDQRFLMKLQLVDAPLLVVYGRDDSWLRQTAEMVSAVNNGNPARKAVLLEASGHFPMLDEPARFNRLILDFLKGDRDLSDLAPKQYWQRRTH
jgi:pimeloyl-ACP methyl ester carboxylesterase